MERKLLVICGPTAVGKTALGIRVAGRFDGEILSADSRQVYRGLDVVTGKDVGRSRFKIEDLGPACRQAGLRIKNLTFGYYSVERVRIWGLDIVGPEYRFSVSDFVKYGRVVLEDIWRRGKLPVVVGGTGMYIQALLRSPETLYIKPDWKLRRDLEKLSVDELQEELRALDRGRFNRMNQSDRLNPRRLIRAIEVGRVQRVSTVGSHLEGVDSLVVGLTAAREELYRRVNERLKELMGIGAEAEVRRFLRRGISPRNPALSSTGAKAFLSKLTTGREKLSEGDREETLRLWQFADHKLVRRQLTWFGHQMSVVWFNIKDKSYPVRVLKHIGNWYN